MRQRTILQLGRFGDIANILPALYQESRRTGEKVRLVVAKDFSSIIEGCRYIEPVIFDGDFRRIDLALQFVGGAITSQLVGEKAIISQVYGLKYSTEVRLDSFAKESWRLAGFDGEWRNNYPLVFDNRNKAREKKLSSTIKGEYVLVFTEGHSSPFQHTDLLLRKAKDWFPDTQIIHNPRVQMIYDLSGLMENAKCIISTDTAPLHLAQVAPHVPVIALVADTPSLWHGSPLRANHIAYSRYKSFPNELDMIEENLQGWNGSDLTHVYSRYSMGPEAQRRYTESRKTWTENTLGITDSYVTRFVDKMPFIKDILRQACQKIKKDDIIMLHNADTAFYAGAAKRIEQEVKEHGSCHAHRHDYKGHPRQIFAPETGHHVYSGTDLVAFTKGWWQENQNEFPDMVIGGESWDWIFRELIKIKGGSDVTGTVYHFRHKTDWETYRMQHKPSVHNRILARTWLKNHNMPLRELNFRERGR